MRGATPPDQASRLAGRISIHAPREGSDLAGLVKCANCGQFQSTLPVRGATRQGYHEPWELAISIHAPREGSDLVHLAKNRLYRSNFNPRSP